MAKNISSIDATKIYLLAELNRIFSGDEIQLELKNGIDNLSEKNIWRLLEALSFSYRMNGMFWLLSDQSFEWREEEIDCSQLTLTGMNPEIDAVTYSEEINNDPIKFRDYLIEYFKNNPNQDPQGLEQFRPLGKIIKYPTIFLTQENGKFNLLDGSNRLMATLMQGGIKINAIIGVKTKIGKPRVGDSVFLLLREMYKCGNVEDRKGIVSVLKQLVRESTDGKDAIKEYWIKHVRDNAEIKKVGESLIL